MRKNNNLRMSGRDIAVMGGLLMVVFMIILTTFATTGMHRSTDAGMSLQDVDTDIRLALLQVDVTNASLENIIRPGQPDVGKALDEYSDNVEKMEKRGRVLLMHVDEMSARQMDYFAEWKKQGNSYANLEIKRLGKQHQIDMIEFFERISSTSVGARSAFTNYLSDIKEIDQYLTGIDQYFTNELTLMGIESIALSARKTIEGGKDLKEAVKPVVVAIDGARDAMTQKAAK